MSGSGGEVRQRPTGLWEGRFWAEGRRRSVYGKTKAETQTKLRAALLQAEQGIRPVSQETTVGAYLEEWLATSVASRCKASTARNYADIVRLYITPAIGRAKLAKLEPEHVQRMLSKLTARGDLSPTTVRYAYAVLRIALGRALKSGRVLRNVATLIDPPTKAHHELAPLTAAQVGVLLDSLTEDRFGALYATAIGIGLRQGELLGLRWSDVDLDGGTLSVRHTLDRRTRTLTVPKTEQSRRTLTMPAFVVAALRGHRQRQRVVALEGYVFTTGNGQPLDSRNVTRYFQAALVRAGLPRQRFHDMRHACATLLLERGEELAVVSKLLGHSTLSTTADTYAHLTRDMQQRAADRMDAILGRASGT